MKKWIALLLAFVMVFGLTACSKEEVEDVVNAALPVMIAMLEEETAEEPASEEAEETEATEVVIPENWFLPILALAPPADEIPEYDFSIVVTVPKNDYIGELNRQIIVTDENGKTDTCLLTQTAGDAMLVVSKTAIELAYTGEAVSFDITSNTSWVIS